MNAKFKAPLALSAIVLVGGFGLTGCSDDSAETTAQAPVAEQQTKAMDVKPPEAAPMAKQPLVAEPAKMEAVQQEVKKEAEKVEAKVEEAVAEKTTEVKAAVAEVKQEVAKKVEAVAVAPSGSGVDGAQAYSTCVGCHGASGEGGVGPRLNNQSVADIVAKLEKYKAGEQVGPMTGMMAPMASGLSTADMQAIAEYITTK